MRKIKTILLGFVIFLINNLNAQVEESEYGCGTMNLLNTALQSNTTINTYFHDYESQLQYKTALSPALTATSYVIPVVFHVIYDGSIPTPSVSYNQIKWQLTTLNEAFANNLNNFMGHPSGSHAANTNISFCFAKKMKSGASYTTFSPTTPGMITYTTSNTNIANIDLSNPATFTAIAALTNYTANFPGNEYLNVWCVPNICNGSGCVSTATPSIIGFGTFPWMTLAIDGVVIRRDAVGNNTFGNIGPMLTNYNKGFSLTHEVGHYLGLFHTFETLVSASSSSLTTGGPGCYGTSSTLTAVDEGDLISQTPPTQINGNIGIGPINTCAETYSPYLAAANESDQLENHMSYTSQNYINTFTQQQGYRMWGALDPIWSSTVAFAANTRTYLPTSTNLSNTGVTDAPSCGPGLLTSAFSFSVLPAATCSLAPVQFSMPISSYLSGISYTLNFGDGNILVTSTPTNVSHTYTTSPYSFTVVLTVSDGTTTSVTQQAVNLPGTSVKIVGQSSSGISICRGSEQTIFLQFPAGVYSAQITDGTNVYTVYNNYVLAGNVNNNMPFTIPINSNCTFSLIPASCGTLNLGTATFSVTDCCANLINNGNLEAGNTGFYTDFFVSSSSIGPGCLRAEIPSLVTGASWTTDYVPDGKSLTVDGVADAGNACVTLATNTVLSSVLCTTTSINKIIFGQAFSGLKTSTNYYVTFKTTESFDPSSCGLSKYGIKIINGTNTLIAQSSLTPGVLPVNVTSASNKVNYWTVFGFNFTTPASLTSGTTSIEVYQNSIFGVGGFDFLVDNILVRETQPSIIVSPSVTIACPSATTQLTANGNCVSTSSYNLTWMPSTGLSCSTCSNPVASPVATTVYTLIAIPPITSPPTPNIIQTVTIFVVPTITVAVASPTPLCNGNTYTLTATGATTYTWQPGNVVGNTFTVAPTSSTIYTVTGTGSLSCTGTQTVQITPPIVPTLTISPDPNPICIGQTSGLNPLGPATSFTWLPSGSLSCSTCTNPIASPTITTTYTVYGSGGTCPVNPGVLTLTVNPLPTLTLSANPQISCVPVSSTLTASGASTYTWNPGNLNGSQLDITHTVTTNYTVSGTDANGCVGTATLTFYYTSCTACTVGISLAPSATTVTGTSYINNTYNIQNDLTINGTVTFSNTSVLISPNKKIIVATGALLKLDNSHLLACTDMWEGIVIEGSGRVQMVTNTLIEDAKIALDASAVNGSTVHISINKGVLNKNYTGIKFNGQSLNGNTHRVLDLKQTVITKRTLYSTIATSSGTLINVSPINTSTLNNYNTSGGNALAYQYSVSVLSNASFKNAAPSWTLPIGIYCKDVGSNNGGSNVPTTSTTWYDLTVGTNTNNATTNNTIKCVMDNLHYGIYAENSNLNVTNTAFQNIYGMDDEGFRIGEAIHAVNTNTATYHHLVAKNGTGTSSTNSLCDFIENYFGVYSKDYTIIDISNNRLYSNATYTPAPATYATGWMGYWLSSYKYVNIDVKNNTLKNTGYPITFYCGIPTSTTTAVKNLGNVNINTNTIDGTGSGHYVLTAIIAENVAASTTFTNISSLKTNIQGNGILGAFNGAQIKNWNASFPSLVMSANSFTVLDYGVSTQYQYGIYLANNVGNVVTTNTVTGPGYVSTNEYAKNLFWSASCTSASITCNVVKEYGRGFLFNGNNGSSKWLLNNMKNADKGYVLQNTGVIGTQGSSTSACDNYWDGTWTGRSQTYMTGTSASTNSILYVRTSASYSPTLNNVNDITFDVAYSSASLPSGSSSTISCSGGGGGGGRYINNGIEYDLELMEDISLGKIKFEQYKTEDDFNYKFQVYRALRNDKTILSQSPVLNGFYNANKTGVMELYCNAEESFGKANNTFAISSLGSYTAKNNIESNYDLYYSLYDKINNGSFNKKTDGVTLYNLASLCPHSDGLIVYNARTLYNFVFATYEYFKDCEDQSLSKRYNSNSGGLFQNYSVYPNPSSGRLYISSLKEYSSNSTVEVKDVAGKVIYKGIIPVNEKLVSFDLDVRSGIYFVTLYENGLQVFVQKVVINK